MLDVEFSWRLVGVIGPRVGAGEGARGGVAIHRGGAGGGDIDDRAVAIARGDDVVGRVACGTVPDDQAARGIDVDAAVVARHAIGFQAVFRRGRVNARTVGADSGAVFIARIAQDQARSGHTNAIPRATAHGAVFDGRTGGHVNTHASRGGEHGSRGGTVTYGALRDQALSIANNASRGAAAAGIAVQGLSLIHI